MKRLLAIGASLTMFVAVSLPAFADYGNTHQWELEFSFNCDNPTLCTANLGGTGGFWGWVALNGASPLGPGTGDAEVAGCDHTIGGIGGPGGAGASHMSANVTWVNSGGLLLVFAPNSPNPTQPVFVAPAKPGHYDNDQLFLPQLPGVSVQLQVVENSTTA